MSRWTLKIQIVWSCPSRYLCNKYFFVFITSTLLIIRECQTSSPLSSLWWKTKLTLFGALSASWTGWPPTLSSTRLVINWFSMYVYVFFAGRHEEATGGVVSHPEVCRPCLLQLPWCKGSSVIPYSYSLTQITMTCVIFSFQESGNLYFCFRWLLIWFKREFSFPDTCSLWEALWTKMWVPLSGIHISIYYNVDTNSYLLFYLSLNMRYPLSICTFLSQLPIYESRDNHNTTNICRPR